jgi:hypothetical protein
MHYSLTGLIKKGYVKATWFKNSVTISLCLKESEYQILELCPYNTTVKSRPNLIYYNLKPPPLVEDPDRFYRSGVEQYMFNVAHA